MSKKYWLDRELKWMAQQQLLDKELNSQIEKYYLDAIDNIEKDISQFYLSYAKAKNISMSEAIKQVNSFNVRDFETTAAKMVKDKDFSDYANERLKTYNATMRINRLEYLKAKIGTELIKAGVKIEKDFNARFNSAYIEERKRQAGILHAELNDKKLNSIAKTIANADFHGAKWSARIWANNDVLKSELDKIITKSMIQGVNPTTMIKDLKPLIKKNVKNATEVAKRIAITEVARIQDQAQNDAFKDYGVEYVIWIYEQTACDRCVDRGEHNGGIYKRKDAPSIPEHPRCRCSKAAYFDRKELESY